MGVVQKEGIKGGTVEPKRQCTGGRLPGSHEDPGNPGEVREQDES
jgi:hypothetical protein